MMTFSRRFRGRMINNRLQLTALEIRTAEILMITSWSQRKEVAVPLPLRCKRHYRNTKQQPGREKLHLTRLQSSQILYWLQMQCLLVT
ncbi:hypothetical protein FKM82_006796 [Ascaphus truei]